MPTYPKKENYGQMTTTIEQHQDVAGTKAMSPAVGEVRGGEETYHLRPISIGDNTLTHCPCTIRTSQTGLRHHSPSCPQVAPVRATLVEFHRC
jgi:hypothetical protein